MKEWLLWAILGGAFLLFVIIQAFSGSKKPFKMAVSSMALGIVALAAVNLCGWFTGVTLPVSTLSVSVAAVGGIPGVTLMLVLNMFF